MYLVISSEFIINDGYNDYWVIIIKRTRRRRKKFFYSFSNTQYCSKYSRLNKEAG